MSYLSKTKRDFSKEFVLTDIEHLNHAHKDKNKELKVIKKLYEEEMTRRILEAKEHS
jgi:hypothetical protein